jgi:hypothetical protein
LGMTFEAEALTQTKTWSARGHVPLQFKPRAVFCLLIWDMERSPQIQCSSSGVTFWTAPHRRDRNYVGQSLFQVVFEHALNISLDDGRWFQNRLSSFEHHTYLVACFLFAVKPKSLIWFREIAF